MKHQCLLALPADYYDIESVIIMYSNISDEVYSLSGHPSYDT